MSVVQLRRHLVSNALRLRVCFFHTRIILSLSQRANTILRRIFLLFLFLNDRSFLRFVGFLKRFVFLFLQRRELRRRLDRLNSGSGRYIGRKIFPMNDRHLSPSRQLIFLTERIFLFDRQVSCNEKKP